MESASLCISQTPAATLSPPSLLDYTSGVQVGINHCYYYLKSQDASITTKVTITSILTEEKPL